MADRRKEYTEISTFRTSKAQKKDLSKFAKRANCVNISEYIRLAIEYIEKNQIKLI